MRGVCERVGESGEREACVRERSVGERKREREACGCGWGIYRCVCVWEKVGERCVCVCWEASECFNVTLIIRIPFPLPLAPPIDHSYFCP